MAPRSQGDAANRASYPLYGTTFSLHRVSPLYHGTDASSVLLDDAPLAEHARRFQDVLKGEVLRGVRVGLDTGPDEGLLGRAGALLSCSWTVLGEEQNWNEERNLSAELEDEADLEAIWARRAAIPLPERRGILVEVEYERSVYTALLVRKSHTDTKTPSPGAAFTHLPLLLTRMPGPLRETLLDYLASTFDTHISPLTMGSDFLAGALETFLRNLTARGRDGRPALSSDAVTDTVKDVQINLSFSPPVGSPLIKGLDIALSRDDVLGFVAEGKKIAPAPSASTARRRDRDVLSKDASSGPFMTALSRYLQTNLALPLPQPEVRISRIGCGAFVLGSEGKVKIFAPSRSEDASDPGRVAVRDFVKALVSRAEGSRILGEND